MRYRVSGAVRPVALTAALLKERPAEPLLAVRGTCDSESHHVAAHWRIARGASSPPSAAGDPWRRFARKGIAPRVDVRGPRRPGELSIGGITRPVSATLARTPDGRLQGTIPLRQSDFGTKPYKGLMGALKVRDDVKIVDVAVPVG